MPRKAGTAHPSTVVVVDHMLLTADDDCWIDLYSMYWKIWLEESDGPFYFCHEPGGYTAKKQARGNGQFWYAYKRIKGKLHCKYLGNAQDLTLDRLNEMAAIFTTLIQGEKAIVDSVSIAE